MSILKKLLACSALVLAVSAAQAQPLPAYDLLLRGGRVIDAKNNIDAVMDVAIKDGRIAKVAPDEIRRNITLPTPGTESLRREPPPLIAPTPRVAAPGPAVPSSQQLLDESQRRRQLELQTQLPPPNTPTPDPAQGVIRQQQQQTQQLQFEREQRAGSLGSEIMRESDRALRR